MKKRILAFMLVLVMIFSMVPVTAFAKGESSVFDDVIAKIKNAEFSDTAVTNYDTNAFDKALSALNAQNLKGEAPSLERKVKALYEKINGKPMLSENAAFMALKNYINSQGGYVSHLSEEGMGTMVMYSQEQNNIISGCSIESDGMTMTYIFMVPEEKNGNNKWGIQLSYLGVEYMAVGEIRPTENAGSNVYCLQSNFPSEMTEDMLTLAALMRGLSVIEFGMTLVESTIPYDFSDFGLNDEFLCYEGHTFEGYARCQVCNFLNPDGGEQPGPLPNPNEDPAFTFLKEYLIDEGGFVSHYMSDDETQVSILKYDEDDNVIISGFIYEEGTSDYVFIVVLEPDLPGDNVWSMSQTTGSQEYMMIGYVTDEDNDESILAYTNSDFPSSKRDKAAKLASTMNNFAVLELGLTLYESEAEYDLSDYGFNAEYICHKEGHTYEDSDRCQLCNFLGEDDGGDKPLQLVDTSKIFKDVPKNAWFKTQVDYAYTYGIFNGTTATTFSPNQQITRAQFVQVLANLSDVDTSNKNVKTAFKDVPKGKWYTPAVKWAFENGIVSGTSATTFSPDAPITREQMCVMLVNYAKFRGITLKEVEKKVKFKDDKQISSWAKEEVYTCQMADLVNGKGDNKFDPKATATRAEAATIFKGFHYGYIIKA